MPPSELLGARLGPRLADMMAKAVVSANQQLTPHKVKTSMQFQESFFKLIASEAAFTVSGLTNEIAEHPDIPPWLADTLNFMGKGTGQFAAILNGVAYGTGMGQGFGAIMANLLAPYVQNSLQAHPNSLLPPELAARLVAIREWPHSTGARDAARQGINEGRFQALVDASEQLPDTGSLLEMYRRGSVNKSTVLGVLRKMGIRESFLDDLAGLHQVLLSAEELANLVDRGEMTQNEAESRAQQVGIEPHDFRKLVTLVGVPPATELMLAGRRRGLLTSAELARGIRQSPLRSEWIPFLEKLQFDPLSQFQAADLVSQNLLSLGKGREIANDNGVKSDDFDLMVQVAGRPPGVELMLELWNRGEVTEAEVKQALLESPVKNKWVPLIMKTRRRIPPQEQVRMMIKNGVITAAEGVKKFLALGYSSEDARAFAELAQTDKTETDRNLTKAEVMNLYEFRLQSADQAKSLLSDLGYDEHEIALLLALCDFRKSKRELDAAASVIRSKYVAHKISDNECSSLLDSLHVPADARDHLMNLWGLERDANQRELTPAEVLTAAGGGLITRDDARTRLLQMGYSAVDTEIKLTIKLGSAGA